MDSVLEYLSTYSVQANFVRRLESQHPTDRLAAFARASASHGIAFTRAIATDGSEVAVEDSADWWTTQLARGDALQRQFGGLVLTTDVLAGSDPVNAAYNVEAGARRAYARLRVDLPEDRGALNLAAWVADAAVAFDAEIAWIHTSDLLAVVRGARAPTDASSWWSSLSQYVIRVFSSLRPASELDICTVPEAVWWMNVWTQSTAARFEGSLSQAGWHCDRTLPSGRRLLIATADPPDSSHPNAIARVAAITGAIGLARHQRA